MREAVNEINKEKEKSERIPDLRAYPSTTSSEDGGSLKKKKKKKRTRGRAIGYAARGGKNCFDQNC